MADLTWADVVAIVGAAAWIPPIFSGISKWRKRPLLKLSPARECEVGFTERGPVFNLGVAITADHDVLIESIDLEISHESGARYNFSWHEIHEVKGQLIMPGVPNQPVVQESVAIALKILPTDFKYVVLRNRFSKHTDRLRELDYEWNRERRRLINAGTYDPEQFTASTTVQEYIEYLRSQQVWKSGNYTVQIAVKSRNRARVEVPALSFTLANSEIELLHVNLANIPRYMRNCSFLGTDQADKQEPLEWHWLTKKLNHN